MILIVYTWVLHLYSHPDLLSCQCISIIILYCLFTQRLVLLSTHEFHMPFQTLTCIPNNAQVLHYVPSMNLLLFMPKRCASIHTLTFMPNISIVLPCMYLFIQVLISLSTMHWYCVHIHLTTCTPLINVMCLFTRRSVFLSTHWCDICLFTQCLVFLSTH